MCITVAYNPIRSCIPTSVVGLRRLSDASVVLRGCATVDNITMDECYLAKDHKESLVSMFGSEVKLAKIEGGICFCDGNLCNNMVHTTRMYYHDPHKMSVMTSYSANTKN